MKKSSLLVVISGYLIFFCTGCVYEEEVLLTNAIEEETAISKNKDSTSQCTTTAVKNQLVVKYKRSSLRNKMKIRKKYRVKTVKTCPCADKTLELWDFGHDQQGNPIDIEEKKVFAATDPDLEGVNNNFMLSTTGTESFYDAGTPLSNTFSVHPSSDNTGVGIAVLDTGIQFDHPKLTDLSLYNSSSNWAACNYGRKKEISGWDFVNQDHIPNDNNGHGTIVTSIIANTLKNKNVPFRILPVKIFNKEGKGSYFDLLCGYRFTVKKPGIDIINMSFGWCGEPHSLLQKFITETEEKGKIMLISSSGNQFSDNDAIPHYPSSYTNSNLLSIAAMNESFTDLGDFSNYGLHSVDFAATGSISFPFGDTVHSVSGTSFAAAFATAKTAWFYNMGTEAKHIEIKMKSASNQLNSLNEIKHAAFISN